MLGNKVFSRHIDNKGKTGKNVCLLLSGAVHTVTKGSLVNGLRD